MEFSYNGGAWLRAAPSPARVSVVGVKTRKFKAEASAMSLMQQPGKSKVMFLKCPDMTHNKASLYYP